MTGVPIRDQLADHLITPHNAAFFVIDCRGSRDRTTQTDPVRPLDRDVHATAIQLSGLRLQP